MKPQHLPFRLLGLLVFALASSALAQETAREVVEPRLSRVQFTALCSQFNLDTTQRSLAEMMFADYNAQLDNITRTMEEQANAAGLRTVQDAMTGRTRVPAEELRSKRVAVLRAYLQSLPEVDEALEQLLGGLGGILNDDQDPHWDEALRDLRRSIWLHPRQAASDYQEYAGEGVDVLRLVEGARGDGGELRAVDLNSLHPILHQYELHLEALLVRQAAEHRNGKLLRRIATMERDSSALRELDAAALRRWRELYQLNKATVEQIGEIAATQLGEVPRRWLERFDEASFAWLYPRQWPDRQIEWMRLNAVAPEALERAETMYEQYVARRRELSRQAIDLMLRARLELQMMIYSMMDPSTVEGAGRSVYDELLRNSGEQTTLESNTAASMESLLTSSQREAMRKVLQRPDRRR